MSDYLQAIVLAVVQGLTEFLPISSSAHLILPAALFGWPDQGLAFDVAVHVGSLVAVMIYFRRDLTQLCVGGLTGISQGRMNSELNMVAMLAFATLPAVGAGLLFSGVVETQLRSVHVIAMATLGFGLMLGVADRIGRGGGQLNYRIALLIGLAQALAIVPGTSRSGITMTAALLCGLGREQAARFSFLLSIPVIAGAGLLQILELSSSDTAMAWGLMLSAMLISALTAYACIHTFLRLIERIGFTPFVIYRVLLGLFLLWLGW